MTRQSIVAHFRGLSTDEKLDLLYELWNEVSDDLEQRPATNAERSFLEERLRAIESDPRAGRSWQEVREDLLSTP
ncbi:MAG: addiction module protein [Deltaproteobacteria bacterium]|nr:addiction module protein [Deltaproteobacteria bacterium]